MPVYTVHMPFTGQGESGAAEKSVFVRDGFHFWAFVFGPLWLLVHRLWLATFIYLVVLIGLEVTMSWLNVSMTARLFVMACLALLVGFEAASVWRWSVSRGRWKEVGLVVANDRESAERRFFAHWTGEDSNSSFIDRIPPLPPTRSAGAGPNDIIGLFPQAGGRR